MTILISAANADVCLSMARIVKAEAAYQDHAVIGLSPDGIWPAQHYFDAVRAVPMARDAGYFDALQDAIQKTKPDVFVPFSEAELGYFVRYPDHLNALETTVVINPVSALETFLDKYKTNGFLAELGLPAIPTYLLQDVSEDHLPVIIKPRKSAGSKNMAVIRNVKQLEGFLEERAKAGDADDFIAQQLIDTPQEEYTCVIWRFGGILRTCIFWRQLQGGMTGIARVEDNKAIQDLLQTLENRLEGDIFLNVQLRLKEGVPYIFEINPRFSSTIMMRHRIGFRDFYWTLDHIMGKKGPEDWQAPVGTTIYRVSEECVVRGETA